MKTLREPSLLPCAEGDLCLPSTIQRHLDHNLPLDSLRGVAASCVVVHHFVISDVFSERFPTKSWADIAFFHNAWLLVDLFFVLSGIVMTMNYVRESGNDFSLRSFLVKRLARIYPLHFVMLFVFIMITLAHGAAARYGALGAPENPGNTVGSFFANILLLQASGLTTALSWNAPSWSIGAEFYTYVVFGLMVLLCLHYGLVNRLPAFALGMSAASLAATILILGSDSLEFHYRAGIVRCVYGFFLGVFAMRLVAAAGPPRRSRLALFPQSVALAFSVLIVASYGPIPPASFLAPPIFAALLGLLVLFPQTSLARVLSLPPLVWLGKRSYSIYMTHALVIVLFEMALKVIGTAAVAQFDVRVGGHAGNFALTMILLSTLVLSDFGYRLVEQPGSKLMLRVLRWRSSAAMNPAVSEAGRP